MTNTAQSLPHIMAEKQLAFSVSTKKRTPKYKSVVFEILAKHHLNFYNRI